jgi:hypothetical protein
MSAIRIAAHAMPPAAAGAHREASSGCGLEIEPTTKSFDALAHAGQTMPGSIRCASAAIVGDRGVHPSASRSTATRDALRVPNAARRW